MNAKKCDKCGHASWRFLRRTDECYCTICGNTISAEELRTKEKRR